MGGYYQVMSFTVQEVWSNIVALSGALGVLAALLGAVAAIIAIPAKGRKWLYTFLHAKRIRRENLEMLHASIGEVKSSLLDGEAIKGLRANFDTDIPRIEENIALIVESLDNHYTHEASERKDYINALREQAEVNDRVLKELKLLSEGLGATLDWAISQGANGRAHRAEQAIREYHQDLAHAPQKPRRSLSGNIRKGGKQYGNQLETKTVKSQVLGIDRRASSVNHIRRGKC